MEKSHTNAASLSNKFETLVIIGDDSNAGKLAIQIARLAKIGTIIVIASGHTEHVLKSPGVTHIIDRNSNSIPAQPKTLLG